MSAVINSPGLITAPAQSAKLAANVGSLTLGVFRLPTDPLFYAALTLENIATGSRYRVTRASDGTELATGVAASTTEVLSGIAVYANPMLVKITVRKATTAPKYEPLDTFTYMTRDGASAYIAQIPDPIA